MTGTQAIEAVARHLRHNARGRAAAVRLDDLAVALGLSRRAVERALHDATCQGFRIGTSCANLDGQAGEGVSPSGMGAYWIVTVDDWDAAFANIEGRFRPLAERRRGLLDCRPRLGAEPVSEARRAVAAVTGEAPEIVDQGGQGRFFRPW